MKRLTMAALAAAALITATNINAFAGDTHVGKAVEESAKASGHASAGAAHAIVGSGQVVSAAAAVPLAVSGSAATSVGAASTEIAKDLMQAATAPIGTPLEIAEESVVAGPPPNEALAPEKKTDDKGQKDPAKEEKKGI